MALFFVVKIEAQASWVAIFQNNPEPRLSSDRLQSSVQQTEISGERQPLQ